MHSVTMATSEAQIVSHQISKHRYDSWADGGDVEVYLKFYRKKGSVNLIPQEMGDHFCERSGTHLLTSCKGNGNKMIRFTLVVQSG